MENNFKFTIYDFYKDLSLSDEELTAYIWNEIFKEKLIDFSGEELEYEE